MMEQNDLLDIALALDEKDELKGFREGFHIPKIKNKEAVYLCGNSLGLQNKSTSDYIQHELDKWENLGVEGHFSNDKPWLSYHSLFPQYLTEIIGAKESEIVVMNSLTTNLHLLFASFYQPAFGKADILTEPTIFPSDKYAIDSQLKFHHDKKGQIIVPASDEKGIIATENWINSIEANKDNLALIWISGVNYLTGQAYQLKEIIKCAKQHNIVIGLDLAHAAGNIELSLHDWSCDFAVWCSYKYLNSGPGGVGGAFIHEKHHGKDTPRFEGWWSNKESNRFEMNDTIDAYETAEAWQLSNAPILSMAVHLSSLELINKAGWPKLQEKAKKMRSFFFGQFESYFKDSNQLEIITPQEERGNQLSIVINKSGKEIVDKFRAKGIIIDWRNYQDKGLIRVAPVPLYNTFSDIAHFIISLKEIIDERN